MRNALISHLANKKASYQAISAFETLVDGPDGREQRSDSRDSAGNRPPYATLYKNKERKQI